MKEGSAVHETGEQRPVSWGETREDDTLPAVSQESSRMAVRLTHEHSDSEETSHKWTRTAEGQKTVLPDESEAADWLNSLGSIKYGQQWTKKKTSTFLMERSFLG